MRCLTKNKYLLHCFTVAGLLCIWSLSGQAAPDPNGMARLNPDPGLPKLDRTAENFTVRQTASGVLVSLSATPEQRVTIPLAAPHHSTVRIEPVIKPDSVRVTVREAGRFRLWRIVAMDIEPLETGERSESGRMELDVKFDGYVPRESAGDNNTEKDPLWTVLKSVVANPDQAFSFRNPVDAPAPRRNTWYDPELQWFKIGTTESGRIKITDQIDFTGYDPRKIHVYNQGQLIPVRVIGEDDGIWDSGDSLEFYGESYRNADGTENKYTLENSYWVTVSDENGLRMNDREGGIPGGTIANTYISSIHREENYITGYGGYYWISVLAGETKSLNINVDNPADNGPCTLRFRVMGMTSIVNADPDHHLITSFNGVVVDDATWDSIREYEQEVTLDRSLIQTGTNTISFNMPGDTAAGEIDGIYVDWFELDYPKQYIAAADALEFNGPWPPANGLVRYRIDGFATPDVTVWRRDTNSVIRNGTVTPSGDTFQLEFSDTDSGTAQYIAFDAPAAGVPSSIASDTFGDLKNTERQADYLIVTHPDFEDALQPLIQRRVQQGFSVETVRIQDIYDEFNDGIFSPEVIRDFVSYAYHYWDKPAPSVLLLVGDACWDYKSYLPETAFTNFVPSYGKDWGGNAASSPYDRGPRDTSDLLYGEPMVDEQMVCVSGDDLLPDLLLGRLAVTSPQSLEQIISRTLAYENRQTDRNWWKRCYFINGGVTPIEQDTFHSQSETLIDTLIMPTGGYWKPIRTYKTTEGYEYGLYTDEIIGYLNRGVNLVNYFGHAGTWSWESMLSFDDLSRLDNAGATPFVASMTCNTSRFANPAIQSFGERLMATGDPETGAVAVWGGCNFGGFWSDYYLAYFFYDALFRKRLPSFGEAILYSKLENLIRYPSYAIIIEPYTYLGEPLLAPRRPSRPQIWLSGYTDTHWQGSRNSEITVLAFVTDPDDDIETVELVYAGESIGLQLYDDGEHGDYGHGDGIYGLQLPVNGGNLPAMMINIGIRAVDTRGNNSGIVNGLVSW